MDPDKFDDKVLHFIDSMHYGSFEENVQEAQNAILQRAMRCKECNELAFPVLGTSCKYFCCSCGYQFEYLEHNIAYEIHQLLTAHISGKVDNEYIKKVYEAALNNLNA